MVDNTPIGKIVHAGYFIYHKFWSKGYVTEAFKKVLEYAFTENDVYIFRYGSLSKVTATVSSDNNSITIPLPLNYCIGTLMTNVPVTIEYV